MQGGDSLLNLHDTAVRPDPDQVQRKVGVLHPEGVIIHSIEDKEHSVIVGKGTTVHEP